MGNFYLTEHDTSLTLSKHLIVNTLVYTHMRTHTQQEFIM